MPFCAELARNSLGRTRPVERFTFRSIDRQPVLQRIFNGIDEMDTRLLDDAVPPRDPASSTGGVPGRACLRQIDRGATAGTQGFWRLRDREPDGSARPRGAFLVIPYIVTQRINAAQRV